MGDWKTDKRIRPVFVEIDGDVEVALSNGEGKLFRRAGQSLYDANRIDDDMKELVDYKYLRGVSAHDF